jgi:hypothetical protein
MAAIVERPPGLRLIDAAPTFEAFRDTTCDEFDGIADRLEEVADASLRMSLTTLFLDGPRTLFRFCAGPDTKAVLVGEGSWWTHSGPVVKAVDAGRNLPGEQRESAFRSAMRGRLAVKVDWSKMSYIRTLRIPPDASVRVMIALAAPQAEQDGNRYPGGAVQYVLVLSHLMAQGIYPSEPEPLASFVARST